ncbi:hypothetical protein N0V84_008242 [Fusarium piperis]|uniref:VWFA domain-containing protein n=1 Tax=Fusarium piperis TaxID=1435070 RepID=A0A9W8W8K1_9HYPO|nr:hypothetical protein N0V84_008242 [Fusarium piperis]
MPFLRTPSTSSSSSSTMFSRIKDKFSSKQSPCASPQNMAPLSSNNPFADNCEPSSPLCNDDKSRPVLIPETTVSSEAPPPAYSPVDENRSRGRKLTHLDVGAGRRGASPSPSITSITSAEDKYAFLSTFDTIFVIDDSGSMAGRSWRETRDALAAITPICTAHDPDGIDVYFLNHRSDNSGSGNQAPGGYYNIRDVRQVERLFSSVRPRGATPTGNRLQSILKPYIASLSHRSDSMDTTKPVNIIVITDGAASDDPEAILVHHARKLDALEAPPHQVGIQFFQVGNEYGATAALQQLDDGLVDQGIRDMVDTATWSTNGLQADGILKVVLGAVVRRLDRQPIRNSMDSHRR